MMAHPELIHSARPRKIALHIIMCLRFDRLNKAILAFQANREQQSDPLVRFCEIIVCLLHRRKI